MTDLTQEELTALSQHIDRTTARLQGLGVAVADTLQDIISIRNFINTKLENTPQEGT